MTDKTITVALKLDLDDLAAQFRAAADALADRAAADRYAANEARQREEQLEDAWRSRDWESVRRLQGEAEQREAEPDPLDENDHRDRLDTDGNRLSRRASGLWSFRDEVGMFTLASAEERYGPLRFAVDEPQEAASSHETPPSTPAVDGSKSQRRNLNAQTDLLCPSCGHDIDRHIIRIDGMRCRDWRGCECHWWPSWIAAKLIKQAVKEAAQ